MIPIPYEARDSILAGACALLQDVEDCVDKGGRPLSDTSFWSKCAAESFEHSKILLDLAGSRRYWPWDRRTGSIPRGRALSPTTNSKEKVR